MMANLTQAVAELERVGLVVRGKRNNVERAVERVASLLGDLPPDLEAFYRENLHSIGPALAVRPVWNDHAGWRTDDDLITRLLPAHAAPLAWDGCGSLYGLDLSAGRAGPAVYFFDHEDGFARPHWAAGSSMANFLLILGYSDKARAENWPERWELTIDPDIEKCPRAPAIWNTD